MDIVAAIAFGIVAGLRTFTAEAVFFGLRGGVLGIVFPVAALGEYAVDLYPHAPARTVPGAVLVRCASGAFMGWTVARVPGIVAGLIGALIGTFGGYRLRMWLIAVIKPVPAGLLEDALAIALAFAGMRA